jgi:phosphoribosyl-ATP pyrophosphohydrolase/phosphoribosyl-AMP cyclohydrolase
MSDSTKKPSPEVGRPLTDRRLAVAADLDGLDFEKGNGLLPMVAQDATDGAVLMVAYASREALAKTLETGLAHFWSRSRQALWQKGETSGHVLRVVSLHADCDGDSLLVLVDPAGPACHTGEATCFGAGTSTGDARHASRQALSEDSDGRYAALQVLGRLDETLAERARRRPEGSYTAKLLGDENLRLKKLGEEAAELVTALAKSEGERAAEEAADLLYHTLVALRAEGVGLDAVLTALEARAS